MSHSYPTAASSSSSNFQPIFNSALDTYKKRTRKDLRTHPLGVQLQACDSPGAILAVLQEQVQGLDQSRSTDERWTKWLDPTINVVYNFSNILGAGVSLAFSPASVIFAGVGALLSAAKDVRASQDTLFDIFERIGMFFRRLEIYTETRPTTEMMEMIVLIIVEVLTILGIVMKEIKQGRIKKFVKKLIGRTKVEDGMKRLDRLTHEEAWMGIAQNLRATHDVGENVRRVVDEVAIVDDRVRVVDDRVAEVSRDGKEVKAVVQQTAIATQQTATDVDQIKRNQMRESIHGWLSPPDPSTNHNIACATPYKKTASWFFQGSIFQDWKATGSLLWVHGKPGSGKSVICSTVIQDIEAMREAGNASLAYFYFDFRDANKQGLRDLVLSLLTQLSAGSGPRCDILMDLHSTHDKGKNQPSDSILAECLKQMLTLPNQDPIYLIIDALDESPNTTGVLSPRERVLQLLEELVELHLPNLRICVTSRPEIDMRDVLEPLTSRRVSLHDESGQKQDIEDYVKSVVYSNSQPIMRRWKTEDKELVIKVLSERADGMFRWIFCQLEVLRQCLPPNVRRTLDELPESLDETYERVLKEIKKPNREHTLRVLQCLVVAIRPLRVEELAEVLAVDFDDEDGMPKLNPDWRWEDQEQALLASCSSLIAIVEFNVKSDTESVGSDEAPKRSRIVQFSHFSVKEYLTSDRLATSSGDISRYHIDLVPAHTILAQACMSVLLRLDDRVEESGVRNDSPLALYAAEHWVVHAQDEKVSSCIRKAMEYLFDLDKPYFTAWLELHDIDTHTPIGSTFYQFTVWKKSGSPLYYAARCGFQDLVEHLIANNPEHVNTEGGFLVTPLVAALARGHFQIAKFLYDNGAHPNVRGHNGMTPLHSAAFYGESVMVQVLLEYKADVHARDFDGATPLHLASRGHENGSANIAVSLSNVTRQLLEHGANVNARANDDATPLYEVARNGSVEAIRMLLELGADIKARKNDGTTLLHEAARNGSVEVVHMLLELSADVNARKNDDTTPLHQAARNGIVEVIHMLLELGADVNARKNDGTTPLHEALEYGRVKAIHVLLELGADVNARKDDDTTVLHKAAGIGIVEVIRMLLELGADINARKKDGTTLLHEAAQARNGGVEAIRMLIELGADVNARKNDDTTLLHEAARSGSIGPVRMLLELGANVGAEDSRGRTASQVASYNGIIRLLSEHVAT